MNPAAKTYFIVNPVAGSGRTAAAAPIIERTARERGLDYSLIYTGKQGDMDRVAGLIDMDSARAIVCVGGDGTVQEYAGLAIGRGVKFGVIPTGSANDLLYSVPNGFPHSVLNGFPHSVPNGLPHPAPGAMRKFRTFDEKVAHYTERAINGETVAVDAVSVNDSGFLLNIGGTGIDIQVLQDALPLKKFIGGGAYFLSLIKNVATYKATEMKLTVDGVSETGKFILIAICNGSYYGGNMRIAPPAVIDDGKITFCKVRKMSWLKTMAVFPAVKPGWHTGFKEVSYTDCSEVVVEYSGKKTINLDGNLAEYASPLRFKILKSAVNFIV